MVISIIRKPSRMTLSTTDALMPLRIRDCCHHYTTCEPLSVPGAGAAAAYSTPLRSRSLPYHLLMASKH